MMYCFYEKFPDWGSFKKMCSQKYLSLLICWVLKRELIKSSCFSFLHSSFLAILWCFFRKSKESVNSWVVSKSKSTRKLEAKRKRSKLKLGVTRCWRNAYLLGVLMVTDLRRGEEGFLTHVHLKIDILETEVPGPKRSRGLSHTDPSSWSDTVFMKVPFCCFY